MSDVSELSIEVLAELAIGQLELDTIGWLRLVEQLDEIHARRERKP